MSGLTAWLARYAKGITAAAGAALTILTAVYAGHTPHWLVWVVGLATALGVVAVPNKAMEPFEQLLTRVIRRELTNKPVPGPGGNAGGSP